MHEWLHAFGIDVVRYPGRSSAGGRRIRLLRHHGIDVVFDVGANAGQYGRELRRLGYRGRIISFEPLPTAFAELARRTARDEAWVAIPFALGDVAGEATLHVAGNSVSSSFLDMLPTHLQAAPASRFVSDVQVQMSTLGDIIGRYVAPTERLFVKVDAQGFERRILAGAGTSMDRILGLQLEMSIVPLYEGSSTMVDLLCELEAAGFTLMSVEPGFSDPRSGRLLQLDGVLFRDEPGRAEGKSRSAARAEDGR